MYFDWTRQPSAATDLSSTWPMSGTAPPRGQVRLAAGDGQTDWSVDQSSASGPVWPWQAPLASRLTASTGIVLSADTSGRFTDWAADQALTDSAFHTWPVQGTLPPGQVVWQTDAPGSVEWDLTGLVSGTQGLWWHGIHGHGPEPPPIRPAVTRLSHIGLIAPATENFDRQAIPQSGFSDIHIRPITWRALAVQPVTGVANLAVQAPTWAALGMLVRPAVTCLSHIGLIAPNPDNFTPPLPQPLTGIADLTVSAPVWAGFGRIATVGAAAVTVAPLHITARGLMPQIGTAALFVAPVAWAARSSQAVVGTADIVVAPLAVTARGTSGTIGAAMIGISPPEWTARGFAGTRGSAAWHVQPPGFAAIGGSPLSGSAALYVAPIHWATTQPYHAGLHIGLRLGL